MVLEHRMLRGAATAVSTKDKKNLVVIEEWHTNRAFFRHVITSGGSDLDAVGCTAPPEAW